MEHEMKLKAIYFDLITTGKKIYEIRLNDEKRRQIKVGDTIIFKKEPLLMDTIKAKVENLTYFQSFKEMLDILPLYQIGFQENTKDEVENIYHSFYPESEEKQYGIVAIKIKTYE